MDLNEIKQMFAMCISSEEAFANLSEEVATYISGDEKPICDFVILFLSETVKNQKKTPIERFFALRVLP